MRAKYMITPSRAKKVHCSIEPPSLFNSSLLLVVMLTLPLASLQLDSGV